MLGNPFKCLAGITPKIWMVVIIIYLFPPFFVLIDLDDQYFHNILWSFYLLPTLIVVYNKGGKHGLAVTGISTFLFLLFESLKEEGIQKHDIITLSEILLINFLLSITLGILVKKTKLKQYEVFKLKNLLESIFNNLDLAIWSIGNDKQMLLSKGIEKIYGQSRENKLSTNRFWKELILPADLQIAVEIDKKWDRKEEYEYEYRILRPNGEIRWIRDQGFPVINEDGELERYDGSNTDITRQKELEFDLNESKERYKSLVENVLAGVFMIQNHKLVYVNQWFTKILGVSQRKLLGSNFLEYIKEDKKRVFRNFQKLIEGNVTFLIDEIQIAAHDETTRFLELQATLTSINGTPAIIGIALDVTEKKKTKAELEYRAYHDTLTGLHNMNYLNSFILEDFYVFKTEGKPVSMMFFNLNQFKLINDSFGHHVGDQMLKLVSKRLIDSVVASGTVIRAGGDDFIIYLPNTNEMQAKDFASYLLKYFSEPFNLEEQEIRISASIGIAQLQKDDSLDDVIQKAGAALHVAKKYGGNYYQIYTSEFGEKASRRLQLEQRLRLVFEQKGLEVFYQPKLDVFTNQITGMEALARWNDPVLGPVSPVEFIPIAEETGMIYAIGKWVLERACKQNSEWQKNGYPLLHVCVNISSMQFLHEDFVPMIEQVLKDSGLPPAFLNLEITEGIALYNVEEAIDKLKQLKQLGVSISLDDFGTGYSSLSYLKSLPIDFLKIDRSFINDIFKNKQDAAIIDSFISLAHTLGLRVVAEGVEDEQQLRVLGEMNCDEIQGFYYARPMSSLKMEEFFGAKVG